jgi:DNA-binding phage protein
MPHINYSTFSELKRFQEHPELRINPRDIFRGRLNEIATPIQLIQALGAQSVDLAHLGSHLSASPPEWIPALTKYFRDFDLAGPSFIFVLEHFGNIRTTNALYPSLERVLRTEWMAPIEDLSKVYFSGLLENREFRHTEEILGQLKRRHLPDGADFDLRVKQFALKKRDNAEAVNNLYNDLTALKLYNDRTHNDVSDGSIDLLLDPHVRNTFRNDFAKLISFAKDRLPPDADEQTWKDFIIWKNVKPTDPSSRGLETLLDTWSRLEQELRKETITWDNAADLIDFPLVAFSLSKNGAWSHLLQDPLVMEFFEKKLPYLYALVRKEIPERVSLSYRCYEFLARRFESGEVTTREQAADLIHELKWIKDQYKALVDGAFPSSEFERFETLVYNYTSDRDFTDLFFGEFPNLFKLAAHIVPEVAGIQMRALCFVLAVRQQGKLKNIENAKNTLECIPHLELFQKALQDGNFDSEDFKWVKFFDVAFIIDEFKRLFPIQFPFLEALLNPEGVATERPQVAGLYRIFQSHKKNEITSESAEQLYKDLLALDAKEEDIKVRIELYERWLACKDAHPELFSQLVELFPVLNAIAGDPLLAKEPEMKAFLTVFKAYKNGKILTNLTMEIVYNHLCALLMLERKEALTIEEQRTVALNLYKFISGVRPNLGPGLSALIPQAFHHEVPQEDDPYFISAVHYAQSRRDKDQLKLLLDIQKLDDLLPVQSTGWINATTGLRKRILENCDQQTLEFVRSKFPYTAYAIDVMRRCPVSGEDWPADVAAEGALFWGESDSILFKEEFNYRDQHCRQGITLPYTNLTFGDCTLMMGGKERKVVSWFIRTALPESAYAIEAGQLKFRGDWSEEELSRIVEYCYTGNWASDVQQLSFAKKAKEQGLEALYRAICANMIVHSNPNSAAALYPEAHKEGLSHLVQGLLKTVKRERGLDALPEEERVARLALIKTLPDNGEPHADWTVAPLPPLNSFADLGLVEDYTLIGSDGEVHCNKGILSLSSELFARVRNTKGFSDVETELQAKFEELDSEALLLAVQFANTRKLPEPMTEEAAAKLWCAANVLEMPNLKKLLSDVYDIQEDYSDAFDPEDLELAVQIKNTATLPADLSEETAVKLWDLADEMEMPALKTLLEANYDLRPYCYSKLAVLTIKNWKDAGFDIDEEREAHAWSILPSMRDFDSIKNHQDLIWIPRGLQKEELEGYIFALVEDENLRAHLLALIEENKIVSEDQWILLYKREMDAQPGGFRYTVHNRIAFRLIA